MPAGTSLGHGIGLQTPRGLRSPWLDRLANENRQDELAQAKADQDLIKETDIDVDFGTFYPKYAKEMKRIYSTALSDIARYKQANDGRMSPSVVKERMLRARQEAGTYEMANAEAKRYVTGQGFLKNPELVRDITSADGTVKDLQKHNRGQFIQVGQNGEFAFLAVPDKEIGVKYDDTADRQGKPTGKIDRIGNKEWQEVDYSVQPAAVQRETMQLYGNHEWRQQELFRAGNEVMPKAGEDEATHKQRVENYLLTKAGEKATKLAPLAYSKWVDGAPYHPPQSGGSEAERRTPTVVKSQGAIMIDVPTATRDKDGKQVETSKPAQQQAGSYDYIVNIGDTKPVTVTVTSEMVKLNPQLKGIKSINVKPTTIYRVRTPEGYGLMTRGVVQSMEDSQGIQTQFGEEGSSGKITKSFEPIFPYDVVQSEVERTYPNKMSKIYTDLEIGKKPQKSGGATKAATIIVTVDGKRGEISADQWEAFKKKYPNAKRQ